MGADGDVPGDLTQIPYDLLIRLLEQAKTGAVEQTKTRQAVERMEEAMARHARAVERLEERLELSISDLQRRVRGNGVPGLETRVDRLEGYRSALLWIIGSLGGLSGIAAAVWGVLALGAG